MVTAELYLQALLDEVGYHESPPTTNLTKFAAMAGNANGQKWCATFLAAEAKRLKLTLPSYSASTANMADAFRKAGRFGNEPRRGAFAFYRFHHVGCVLRWTENTVTSVDGNTSVNASQSDGGAVAVRTRGRNTVAGYGYPDYLVPPVAPRPVDRIVVKEGSPEEALLIAYPTLFPYGHRSVKDSGATAASNEIGLGVWLQGSRYNYVGKDRDASLKAALAGEGIL